MHSASDSCSHAMEELTRYCEWELLQEPPEGWPFRAARTPFETWEWTDAAARVLGHTPSIAIGRKGGHVIGFSHFVNSHSGRVAAQPIYTQYGSLVSLREEVEDPEREELRRHGVLCGLASCLEGSFKEVDIVLPPHVPDVRPFLWRGWKIIPRYSRMLDLSLPGSQHTTARSLAKQVRKAEREQIAVHEEDAPERLYDLYETTFQRQGLPTPVPKELFLGLWKTISAQFPIHLFFATWQDKPVAANAVVHYGDTVWDWVAGTSEMGRSMGAPSLLKWKIAEWFREQGARFFDLCGIDHPTIGRFKSGFGGDLVSHFQIKWGC